MTPNQCFLKKSKQARSSSAPVFKTYRVNSERFLDFDEALQLPDTRRVTHLAQRLRFDLADAFAGNLELLADFLQCAGIAVAKAET